MLTIKFSHDSYNKFREQEFTPQSAVLMEVFLVDRKDMSSRFIEYDTMFWEKENGKENRAYYNLPAGRYMVLLLKSNHQTCSNLWTTIRRWTPKKEEYYKENIGAEFAIRIIKEEK